MATLKHTAPKARLDLSLLRDEFCHALAVMECALMALDANDADGPEAVVLRMSFDMLNAAYTQLDEAADSDA